jgi:hypothetical protein
MRQQLDELDALLQRMLTLPVNQPSEASGPAPEPPPSPPVEKPKPRAPLHSLERFTLPPLPAKEQTPPAPVMVKDQPPSPRPEPPAKRRGPVVVFQPVHSPTTLTVASSPSITVEPLPETKEETSSVVMAAAAAVASAPAPGWGPIPEAPPTSAPILPPQKTEPEPELPPARSPFLERHQARLRERRRSKPWMGPLAGINYLFDRFAIVFGSPGLWLTGPDGRAVLGWMGLGFLLAALAILAGDWLGWSWPGW